MKGMENPARFVHIWRFVQLFILSHFWIISEVGVAGFIFILLLMILTSLRIRFELPGWSFVIDLVICTVFLPFYTFALFGLAIPLFEALLKSKWIVLIPHTVFLLIYPDVTDIYFWYSTISVFIGYFLFSFLAQQKRSMAEADTERKARYELEQMRMELLTAYSEVEKTAELKERNRISRELHDHLGHDLTGALLAVQAHEHVGDLEEGRKLLKQVEERLQRSTTRLRQTAHNLMPVSFMGIERLKQIVDESAPLVVSFQQSGYHDNVSSPAWVLLESCLKEALTNIRKHSNATKVDVELVVTEQLTRLEIHDNGTVKGNMHNGSGIRSLQLRARTLNGSLSVGHVNGYELVCVLPSEKR